MGTRQQWVIFVAIAATLVSVLITRGPPRPTPNPPNTFSFGVLGDAPYYAWEEVKYRIVLKSVEEHDLSSVIHIGDIFWHPCTDALYLRSRKWFDALRHPVIYTPGDNEWADCWEPDSGGFSPLERLQRIRQIFFSEPRSLGRKSLALDSQRSVTGFSEFSENVRWKQHGIVFATVNLVGSRNALDSFPGRTAADDAAAKRRTEAAAVWTRETFAAARAAGAPAVVIGFHVNPAFERPVGDSLREAYEPFITALEEEVERFGKPVLVVQGDHHKFLVDHPLVRRTTRKKLLNLTRMQVPGSPEVGWVRVVVTLGPNAKFTFEPYIVPPWKYW